MSSVELKFSLEEGSAELATIHSVAQLLGIDFTQKIKHPRHRLAKATSEVVPPIDSTEEFIEETDKTFPLVPKRSWDFYTVTMRGMSVAWRTRSWKAAHQLAESRSVNNTGLSESLDMSAVRAGMRTIESGQHLFVDGLGRTAWNALATLNNMFTETDEGRILEWNPSIHKRLARDSNDERRLAVASDLARLYAPILAQVELDQDFAPR